MFDKPISLLSEPEEAIEDSPILLEGVSSADFRALLKLLYPKYVSYLRIRALDNQLIYLMQGHQTILKRS